MPVFPVYNATETGFVSLTRTDALDYSADRIPAHAVCPGIVATPLTTTNPNMRAALDAIAVQVTSMKRKGKPEEIADVALLLCSKKAAICKVLLMSSTEGISLAERETASESERRYPGIPYESESLLPCP